MKGRFDTDVAGRIERRTLLKMAGGAAGGSLAVTAVGSARNGNAKGKGKGKSKGNGGGKQGGRGHTSSDIYMDEPFTVTKNTEFHTNASCMSDNSAEQKYIRYNIHYCDDSLPTDHTFCVIPNESELNRNRAYEFRSRQECKADSREIQDKVSFGPANADC